MLRRLAPATAISITYFDTATTRARPHYQITADKGYQDDKHHGN